MAENAQPLDPDTCTEIVVNHTPFPDKSRGPDQLLKDLGILGDTEVELHKGGIIRDLRDRGLHIDGSDISSGPAVSVGDCAASVCANAS